MRIVSAVYLGLFLVGGESLPERDALVGRQRGELVERAVDLRDAVAGRVAVVVEQDDLERPTRQLRRRHVEHELLLELGAQRAPVDAALQLSAAPVRQQAEPAERVGAAAAAAAARLARHQISSLPRKHCRVDADTDILARCARVADVRM